MKKLLIVAALALTLAPSSARAEWLLTPNVGGMFGGTARDGFTWGASIAWASVSTIFGAEADFGFASNDLLSSADADLFGVERDFLDSRIGTFMGNVLIQPWGGSRTNMFRPYAVAGIGWIQNRVETTDDLFGFDSDHGNFGFDVGGGAMGFFSDNVGVRGDIRYFRATDDFDDLRVDLIDLDVIDVDVIDIKRDFWRATGGVTFRW
jgi:opacity protein-like surface antigen